MTAATTAATTTATTAAPATEQREPQSRISLWTGKQNEDGKTGPVQGSIQITAELLQQLQAAGPNQSGLYSLRCALFTVNSDNPRAPFRSGPVEIPEYENSSDGF